MGGGCDLILSHTLLISQPLVKVIIAQCLISRAGSLFKDDFI